MNSENRYQEIDLGNVAPNPRGAYADEAIYEYLDLVEYEGGSYLCLAELGETISGIAPEPGKNSTSWQMLTAPGDLTPEYTALGDFVKNLAEQIVDHAAEVYTAKESVLAAEQNVSALKEQTVVAAESAESSKDSAAGHALDAESSKQAAEESESNVAKKVNGFDAHVAEKITEATESIETARSTANAAIIAQQAESTQAVKDQTAEYIAGKKADINQSVSAGIDQIGTAVTEQVGLIVAAGEDQIAALQEKSDEIKDDLDVIAQNGKVASEISIKATSSGSNITLDDASDLPLNGLKLYGRSTQFTTTGAQLINAEELVIGGLEGGIGGEFTSANRIRTGFVRVEAGGIYSLSGYAPYVIANSHIFGEDKKTRIDSFTSGAQIPENGCWIRISFKKADEGENTEANLNELRKTIMLNEGSTALPWEPYTGGQPSPNPDYPQEIVSVGDKGSVETKIYGKNLFDAEKYVEIATKTEPGTEVVTFDGRRCLHIPTKVSNANESIFGGFKIGGSYRLEYEIYAISEVSDLGGNGFCFKTERGGKVYALITEKDGFGKWVKIERETKCKESMGLYAIYGAPNECYIDLDSIKLVEGNDMECEPCAVQTLTMQTPNGLPGIPVSSGGNYTDESGQQWICDEVDFERGVYVQRVGKHIVNGNEDFTAGISSYYLTGTSSNMFFTKQEMKKNSEALVNRLIRKENVWSENTSVGFATNINQMHMRVQNSVLGVDDNAATEEKKKAYVAYFKKCYADENPYIVRYILAEPIETPIPPEELAAYRALHSNKPITNIINDEGAHMDVGYTADTERYIDKNYVAKTSYDALEQRVAALEALAIGG